MYNNFQKYYCNSTTIWISKIFLIRHTSQQNRAKWMQGASVAYTIPCAERVDVRRGTCKRPTGNIKISKTWLKRRPLGIIHTWIYRRKQGNHWNKVFPQLIWSFISHIPKVRHIWRTFISVHSMDRRSKVNTATLKNRLSPSLWFYSLVTNMNISYLLPLCSALHIKSRYSHVDIIHTYIA